METTFWHKQGSEPLFPDLEWNKPERRNHAGKICIIGGNIHSLNAPAKAFEVIKETGPSAIKLVLPNKTKALVGKILPEALFLPSTASGEFSRDGEVELLDHLVWADTVLFPGDTGRNSETTILLEDSLQAYGGLVILTRDTFDSLSNNPDQFINRKNTTLVLSFAQLQKLVKNTGSAVPLVYSIDLVKLIGFLHQFTIDHTVGIVTVHNNQIIAAVNGKVSTSKLTQDTDEPPHWRLKIASLAASYQTWYPNQPFEALTESAHKFITS